MDSWNDMRSAIDDTLRGTQQIGNKELISLCYEYPLTPVYYTGGSLSSCDCCEWIATEHYVWTHNDFYNLNHW